MPRSRRRCGSHSGLARCPGSEVRCQSRGRFGEVGKARRRGIVGAIPRRSNAASVVETPPNLVTDFGFGTLGSLSTAPRAGLRSFRRPPRGPTPCALPDAAASRFGGPLARPRAVPTEARDEVLAGAAHAGREVHLRTIAE